MTDPEMIEVPLDDLRDVMQEAYSHLSYWNSESPEYDRIEALIEARDAQTSTSDTP